MVRRDDEISVLKFAEAFELGNHALNEARRSLYLAAVGISDNVSLPA